MISYNIEYVCNGKKYVTSFENNPHFKIISNFENGRFFSKINTYQKVAIKKFQIIFPYEYKENQKCFVNGYQSWTDSKEYSINEKMRELSWIKEKIIKISTATNGGLGRAGDMFFCEYPRKKGVFYGYSYGYIRENDTVDLFASLSERTGYTIISFDVNKSQVIAEKDFEGVIFDGEAPLIDFVHIRGEYDEVFDRWFSIMGIECSKSDRKCGYTTWYNYYRNIDDKIVRRDLKSLSELKEKVDIFQIDDGYQKSIGDWLDADEKKFPEGMKVIADEIHKKKFIGRVMACAVCRDKGFFYI